jgi:hypothetical protein
MLTSPWQAWGMLPRETRDCLFTIGVIALTTVPLVAHIPLWCAFMLALLLLWRVRLALLRKPLPGRWTLAWVLAAAVAGTWLSYRTIIGRDPGVTLLVMLLALKTLEWHSRRDAFVVFFLAFFVLLTNFFHSQSLLTALYMLTTLWAWLTALVLAHRPVGTPRVREAAFTALRMTLVGAPLVAILFVLFPMFAPLWGMPADNRAGRTGLSSSLQVGQMAQLIQDESVAMRIQWLDPVSQAPMVGNPAQSELYFRGPVLSDFDGQVWRAGASPRTSPSQFTGGNTAIAYQTTLEPNALRALLTLDSTVRIDMASGQPAQLQADMQWLSSRNIDQPLRYTAQARLRAKLESGLSDAERARLLRYPATLNPRTQEWARQLRSETPQASALVLSAKVTDHLRQGGYSYTLEPGIYGQHASDEFWFDRKRGFCEHMAEAYVIAMRSMGVPARLVTGYQGGERNGVDGLWTIRQSDAHAWAEIWDESQGWVRIDPTAVVSPNRIGQVNRPVASGAVGQAVVTILGTQAPTLLRRVREVWEAANHHWNQKIIQYTQQQQLGLLGMLGINAPSWQDAVRLLGFSLAVLMLTAAAIASRRAAKRDPWLHLMQRATRRISSQPSSTSSSAPTLTPRELGKIARQRWGTAATPILNWLQHMEATRYGKTPTHPITALRRQFRQISWPNSSS